MAGNIDNPGLIIIRCSAIRSNGVCVYVYTCPRSGSELAKCIDPLLSLRTQCRGERGLVGWEEEEEEGKDRLREIKGIRENLNGLFKGHLQDYT